VSFCHAARSTTTTGPGQSSCWWMMFRCTFSGVNIAVETSRREVSRTPVVASLSWRMNELMGPSRCCIALKTGAICVLLCASTPVRSSDHSMLKLPQQ
jgi:hypothetical protein